jgi:hypothetical protein
MSDFPDDSRAQGETCMKEVLELRHHLAYRDDVLLFILIKTDIVLHRANLRVCYVLLIMTATLCQVKANKATNLRRLVPVVFTMK